MTGTGTAGSTNTYTLPGDNSNAMPLLDHNFALTQAIRCADKKQVVVRNRTMSSQQLHAAMKTRHAVWRDCDVNDRKRDNEDFTTLGYSMRTPEYRYTAYFHFDRASQLPDLTKLPFEEELYDHKNETLADFTHRETYNLAVRTVYAPVIENLRNKLIHYIKDHIKFGDHR